MNQHKTDYSQRNQMIAPITFKKRDDFVREPFAKRLIELVQNNSEIFPLAINGSWGTGKTEFCQKTVHLINQEYNDYLIAEYFDAFSEDSYDQPLTSILARLYKTFNVEHDKRELKRHALNLILATTGAVAENIQPTFGIAVKYIAKIANKLNSDIHEKSFEHKSNTEIYLNELKNFLSRATENKKLVLFIDELDRCRPDYALHLLEVVKHVFDIPNLKIIFIINSKQLIEIVKHNYGNNEEVAKKYLDKFFQFQINLPDSAQDKNKERILNSVKYLDIEFDRLEIFKSPLFSDTNRQTSRSTWLLRELVEYYNLSLRDIEKLARNISVYSVLKNYKEDLLPGFKLLSVYAIFQFTFGGVMYQNYKEFNNAFKQSGDLLSSIPKHASNISYRYILFSILFETGEKTIDHLFDNWLSVHTLDKRREYLIAEFSSFDSFSAK